MSRPTRSFVAGAVALASLAAPVQASFAFDLFAPAEPQGLASMQKVEFGSGWYIRGDVGYEETTNKLDATSLITSAPTVVFDAVSGHQNGYVFSLGGGYKLNDWFRADVTGDLRKDLHSLTNGAGAACPGPYGNISCYSVSKASLTRYDVMANGYIDLGTWSSVTPYVGVGVGAAFGRVGTSTNWYQGDGSSYNIYVPIPQADGSFLYAHYYRDQASSGTYVNFAYALMAGAAIDVYDRTKLDIGYRYFNGGRIAGATGASPLVAHEIRAGLRYMID